MNKLTIAFTLSLLAATSAQADGFSPWSNRATHPDPAPYSVTDVPVSGFAPWVERHVDDTIDAPANFMDGYFSTAFRPWAPAEVAGSPS